MGIPSAAESIIESNLINQLISGISQWTYRGDLKTEEQLWNNFKEKLEINNKHVLDDVPLTEQEFKQVKNQLNFANFYEASKWLVGENGIAKVEVQREDASLGRIRLNVINRADIAGGISSYEVINQYTTFKESSDSRTRRFDVTLLINGLPMIHIELKNRAHSYMDAFRQIKKYLVQGKFTGIFSCVQMFVVSNGSDTRYIAASVESKINEQFLTTWVNKDNQPVTDYLEFAEEVLSIPQAHKMVTQFTVLDNSRKSLILLRPYQIHAIDAVKKASAHQESGYVWHTTGSGKTLTSYKVARNLLQIPSIDKTIFIVDRIDLDQQTSSSFSSYAYNDVIEIDETENVRDLIKKLLSDNRNVVVTTIQKLNFVMKRFAGKEDTTRYKKMTQLKLAFVVDECHRAVSPQAQQTINRFFRNSLWYGFTGTPIFGENAKSERGNLARTTQQQYGRRLHQYTVKEAIHDKAVLGFQIEYKSTLSNDDLDDIVQMVKPDVKINSLTQFEKEQLLPNSIFEKDEHLFEVANAIINKSQNKFGLNNGVGHTYTAILTTSSIALAQRYYRIFKDIRDNTSSIKVSNKVAKKLPDFPRVAITYSVTENEEASISNQEEMKLSIRDYNKMFGTSFSLDQLGAYNRNVNDRLARKQEKYLFREEQLDLVIVVDRLLTGFDAPCLTTLFIDRPPFRAHNLIQAFSRTNRLFDRVKHYGQIVTFQTPTIYEKAVKDALVLYSNGGENEVQAPSWEQALERFEKAYNDMKHIAPSIDIVTEMIISEDKAKMELFAKAFQTVDRTFSAIQVYTDYDYDVISEQLGFTMEKLEEYKGKYSNVLEKLKEIDVRDPVSPVESIDFDIEYQLEAIKTEEINYQYILLLIQSYVPDVNDDYQLMYSEESSEITKYIVALSKRNSKLADLIGSLWENIRKDPENYRGQQVSNVLEEMIQESKNKMIKDFSKKWHVKEEPLSFLVENYNPKKKEQYGESDLKKSSNYDEYKKNEKDPVKKLAYWRTVKHAYRDLIEEDIKPLDYH